jgi:hypothetical protein
MNIEERPIDVTRSTLGGALRNGPLKIPNHQREYSWRKDRVRKLFEDFGQAMRKRQASYFLGTLVQTPGLPPQVIDGQQRLATTTIFLAAVRDALLTMGREVDAKSIEDDFLIMWNRNLNEHVPRLDMNTDDRSYIKARILDRPDDRDPVAIKPRFHSHRKINDAAKIAAERVANIMKEADSLPLKVEALNTWIDFIDRTAVLVMLTPPSSIRAYQMFKTLNDRAQRTTQGDMIKNHLFEQAADAVDEAQAKWTAMRTTIEGFDQPQSEDPMLGYLHHVSIVFYGPVLEEEIFEKMETEVVGRAKSLAFLEALSTYASDYAAIITPTHAKWGQYDSRVRKYIEQISQEVKMSFIRPLMLAIANKFDPAETVRAFQACASWVVRFLIAGGHRSGAVNMAIGETAHAIKEGRIKTTEALADSFGKVVPNDLRFHEAFCTKTIQNARQSRFILTELEAAARDGSPSALTKPVGDTSKLSLEHILPKNLSASKGWEHFSPILRRAYRNRLGNMALVDTKDNGAMNDKPFKDKRPSIEKAKHLMLTADVLKRVGKSNDWTPERIEARQKWMADLAKKWWPEKP